MKSIVERMECLIPEDQAEAAEGGEATIGALALAASSLGIDLDDDKAIDQFIMDLKTAITKEKSKLKSALRRYTSAKAKTAAKAAIKSA